MDLFCKGCNAPLKTDSVKTNAKGKVIAIDVIVCLHCGREHDVGTKMRTSPRNVNTGGGAYIEGDINTGGGDFVGGDQINM